jgi:hypothetical protein
MLAGGNAAKQPALAGGMSYAIQEENKEDSGVVTENGDGQSERSLSTSGASGSIPIPGPSTVLSEDLGDRNRNSLDSTAPGTMETHFPAAFPKRLL